MTPEETNQPVTHQQLRDALREALDRAVETIAAEFSTVRGEAKTRAEATDRRLDRISETLANLESRMGTMTKWANTFDRDNAALAGNFHEQQHAILLLTTRVERIERELHPPQ
jgi:phage shock protein A